LVNQSLHKLNIIFWFHTVVDDGGELPLDVIQEPLKHGRKNTSVCRIFWIYQSLHVQIMPIGFALFNGSAHSCVVSQFHIGLT